MTGIGAAFVDIGLEKNGFLYIDDIIEEGSPYNSDIVQEEMGPGFKKRERPAHHRPSLLFSAFLFLGSFLSLFCHSNLL